MKLKREIILRLKLINSYYQYLAILLAYSYILLLYYLYIFTYILMI